MHANTGTSLNRENAQIVAKTELHLPMSMSMMTHGAVKTYRV